MEIGDLMTRQVQCCAPEDSLEQAARLMWDHDCGCLPVCSVADGGARTVGLITDRDICMCALFEGMPLSRLRVAQAMAKHVLGCKPDDSLEQAERVMQSARVRRLPVLSGRGELLGMVSLADLAREAERGRREAAASSIGHTFAAIVEPLVPHN